MLSSNSQWSNNNGVYDESPDTCSNDSLASTAAVGCVTAAQTHQSQDSETIRSIQVQIIILLHAYKCLRNPNGSHCFLPYCSTMKETIFHMSSCQAGNSCTVPDCCSSVWNIFHWNNCRNNICLICAPLKEEMAHQNARY